MFNLFDNITVAALQLTNVIIIIYAFVGVGHCNSMNYKQYVFVIIVWETRSVSQLRVRFNILNGVGVICELKIDYCRWGKYV